MADMMQSVSVTQKDMMASIIESTLKQKDLEQTTANQRQEMTRVLTRYTPQLEKELKAILIDWMVIAFNSVNI